MGRQVKQKSAGDLRTYFEIYAMQESEDGQGGTARLPVLADTGWGDVVSLSGYRQAASAQMQQRVTHRVDFRYAERPIKITDEIRYSDHRLIVHRLSVKTVVDVNARAKVVTVEAEEIVETNANNPDVA